MRSIKWFLALALAFGLALGSLASAQRMGAWVDEVVGVEVDRDSAILQMQIGVIDMFAFTIENPEVKRILDGDDRLAYYETFGSYNELSFNPVGPVFDNGRLNPFAVPRVREAMNYLIDRDYISQEIFNGFARPKWFPITAAFPDYARYVDIARALELQYAYDMARAEAIIAEEMEKLGATKVGGVWNYNGAPAVVSVLIRTEDNRLQLGDYVANQLEDIGFATERLYRTAAEASPIWLRGNPADGIFHIYTGGWITTAVSRDQASTWQFFYTDRGLAVPLWQAYVNTEEFGEVVDALANSEFTTLEERAALVERAMRLGLQDSIRVWTHDQLSILPRRVEVTAASDLAGGVSGSRIWAHTIRRGDEIGGRVDIALPSVLTEPWNPIGGSNWIYDMMFIRATGEVAVVTDPYTGLNLPNRIERAEVVVRDDLPVGVTLDWVTLDKVPEIAVPADAWVDWDAAAQRWITAGEKFPEGLTALRKSTVYYPADLYDTVTWHDGSAFSAADVVLGMILTFDRGKEASAIYDAAYAPSFNAFLPTHKGYRILSTQPLVIEVYSDNWSLDAENNVTTLWPDYAQGPGAWHNMALGILAETDEALAFTSGKSDRLQVERISFIDGPSIPILQGYLSQAQASGYVPYAGILNQYLGPDGAAGRYANLAKWNADKGHFWLGTGPMYLERAFPLESTVQIKRYAAYPDPATKWEGFGEPPIATVELDGPGRVTIGSPATFEVFVSLRDQPYATADIGDVKYLVFDATGALAFTGDAVAVADGVYEIVLDAATTGQLEVGSNRLEVAVAPIIISIPSFDSLEFVTTR